MVERLFLAVPRGCLQFVNVVFPDHTHLLFFIRKMSPIIHRKFEITNVGVDIPIDLRMHRYQC